MRRGLFLVFLVGVALTVALILLRREARREGLLEPEVEGDPWAPTVEVAPDTLPADSVVVDTLGGVH